MLNPDIIGYIAGTLTTICMLPQAVKTIKTKDTSGISLSMYVMFCAGVTCWLVYGIVLGNIPMILFNSVTLPISLTILYYKIRESRTL